MSYLLLKNNPSTEISLDMKSLREKEKLTLRRKVLDNEIIALAGEATALELVKNIFYRKRGYATIPKLIINW